MQQATVQAEFGYRVWIVRAPYNWRGAWYDVPKNAVVLCQGEPGVFCEADAEAWIQGFNGAANRAAPRWAVMQKVRIVYAGDLVVGEFVG